MSDTQKHTKPNVPNLRFPGFEGEWVCNKLSTYLYENKERNRAGEFNKSDVLSVSGDSGIVNQIELLGRSFAGKSVADYHIVRTGNIVYTKSPLKEYPYGIVKYNSGNDGIVSTLYAVYHHRENVNGRFVEHYFTSPQRTNRYFKPIVRIGAKHDMKIGNSEVLDNTVVFPDLEEQNKITRLLDLLNQRIVTQNKVIEDLKKLKSAIEDRCFYQSKGESVRVSDILIERIEKSMRNNQHEVLSSTVSGIYTQRDYFNKEIASADNTGYKVIRRGDIVLSPQNLWMGNINYNDKFDIGIVSPSYKVFSINPMFNSRYVASLLKSKKALWEYSLVSEQGASIVRRNLSMDGFMEIAFSMPNKEEQNMIGDTITTVNHKLELENNILNDFNRQKFYLLNQLFI